MIEGMAYRPEGPLDPVAQQIADYFAADPMWQGLRTNPIPTTREAIRAGTPVSGEPPVEHVEDFEVSVAGGAVPVRLYRPNATPPAVIVWAHGGGFAMGSIAESDGFCRLLATTSGCAVLSVEYRLAPEHRFPTAVDDLEAATRWVAERLERLVGHAAPIILAGDSAGGNLAAVVTRRLHQSGTLAIAANILAYPNTDNEDEPSLRTFETSFLGVDDVTFFLKLYAPDQADRSNPDFAPIRAPDLGRLPPTLLITAEHDVLTGQVLDYGRRLEQAGVRVSHAHYAGMIHGFLTMEAFFDGSAGEAVRDIAGFAAGIA